MRREKREVSPMQISRQIFPRTPKDVWGKVYQSLPASCPLLITFANNFDPDQADVFGSKLFDTLVVFMKYFFEKTLILKKKKQKTTKKHEKLPSRQRANQHQSQLDLSP